MREQKLTEAHVRKQTNKLTQITGRKTGDEDTHCLTVCNVLTWLMNAMCSEAGDKYTNVINVVVVSETLCKMNYRKLLK